LSLAAGRRRLRRERLPRRGSGLRNYGGPRPAAGGRARTRPPTAHGPGAVPHVDRAPLVSGASGLVHLARRRPPAEQLGGGLRRLGLDARRAHGPVVPALLLPGAARPRLAQPRGGRGDAGRDALLAGPRGRRLSPGRTRSPGEGRTAARRAAGDGPPALPMHRDDARLEHIHSRNDPDVSFALAALREAAGERLLVGEVYLPTRELPRYLDQVD